MSLIRSEEARILLAFSFSVISDSELNSEAFNVPVDGLKNSFDDETNKSSVTPVVVSTNVMYLVAFVLVSSDTTRYAPPPEDPVKPVVPLGPLVVTHCCDVPSS